jgi:folate-dependent phosphoribosylglycinamide formyltransferase PurN
MNKKIRIGILLDNNEIPAWSYTMLQEIIESLSSEIVLIVKNKSYSEKKKPLLKRIIENRKNILFNLFIKIEHKFFQTLPNAFEKKDIRTILSVNTIEVNPQKTKFRDVITDHDINQIKQYNIDLFIRMGFRILSGDILKIAKYGVWSYHHADNKINRGGPAGYWEVLENWKETGVILQILTEDLDGGIILKKSYSLTDNISPTRNKNNYYTKALSILPQEIEKLYELGEQKFFQNVHNSNIHPQFYYNRLYTTPKNSEFFFAGVRLLFNYSKFKINSLLYHNQWILLYKISNNKSLSTSFYQFKKIFPPKDRFWADPHVIKRENKYYIFFEEFIYTNNKGHISLIIMDENGDYNKSTVVLKRNYHLSYPFVFEDNGELYMIPETHQNNTIELYKCTQFPLKWEFELTLIENINAVDSTIIYKNGKYWLFANVVKNKGASTLDELYIYYSDVLTSNTWIPHNQNPVVSDVKRSRPAGNFFKFNNNIYRPSQNSSTRYGYGMKINQVVELTETTYIEKTVDSIFPNWEKNLLGTHTINHVDNLTIIDALIKRRK